MAERGEWQSDFVQYNPGDIVVYNGKRYRNIQGHRSQPDWTPNITPALWGVDNECQPQSGGYQPTYDQKPPQQQWQGAQQAPNNPPPSNPTANSGYTTDNGHQVTQQDSEKKWYDLDDTKKDALIGGGLAVGLAALAGGAYYAHEQHKESEEGAKAQAWELQNWIVAARDRTNKYIEQGPQGPVTWVFSEFFTDRPQLRNDLFQGGEEGGQPWFIARAPHKGGLQLGKFRPGQDASIGFSHEAIHVRQFEALLANPQAVRWVPHSGRFDPSESGLRAVEGGREDNNTPLYIARAHAKEHQGILGFGGGGKEGLYPGKCSAVLDKAFVTVGDKEVGVSDYEVLCYA